MQLSIFLTALLASSALAVKTVTTTKTVTRRARPTTTVTRVVRSTSTVLATDTTTDTETTTATATVSTTTTVTTTSTATPSPTAFDGKGYLYVFPDNGPRKGCLISGGGWYAGGGTCATYVANPVDNMGNFNLTTSKGPCVVQASDSSINCAASNTVGSTFGQTGDGELTYAGSDGFFAKATATGTTQQPVYATAAPVGLSVQWFAI